jgi:hypothetical protein
MVDRVFYYVMDRTPILFMSPSGRLLKCVDDKIGQSSQARIVVGNLISEQIALRASYQLFEDECARVTNRLLIEGNELPDYLDPPEGFARAVALDDMDVLGDAHTLEAHVRLVLECCHGLRDRYVECTRELSKVSGGQAWPQFALGGQAKPFERLTALFLAGVDNGVGRFGTLLKDLLELRRVRAHRTHLQAFAISENGQRPYWVFADSNPYLTSSPSISADEMELGRMVGALNQFGIWWSNSTEAELSAPGAKHSTLRGDA